MKENKGADTRNWHG